MGEKEKERVWMKGLLKAWMGGEEMKGMLRWKEGDIQLNYMYRHYYYI